MNRRGFSTFLHFPVVLFGYIDTNEGTSKGRAFWFRPLGFALLAICLIVATVAISVAIDLGRFR